MSLGMRGLGWIVLLSGLFACGEDTVGFVDYCVDRAILECDRRARALEGSLIPECPSKERCHDAAACADEVIAASCDAQQEAGGWNTVVMGCNPGPPPGRVDQCFDALMFDSLVVDEADIGPCQDTRLCR